MGCRGYASAPVLAVAAPGPAEYAGQPEPQILARHLRLSDDAPADWASALPHTRG